MLDEQSNFSDRLPRAQEIIKILTITNIPLAPELVEQWAELSTYEEVVAQYEFVRSHLNASNITTEIFAMLSLVLLAIRKDIESNGKFPEAYPFLSALMQSVEQIPFASSDNPAWAFGYAGGDKQFSRGEDLSHIASALNRTFPSEGRWNPLIHSSFINTLVNKRRYWPDFVSDMREVFTDTTENESELVGVPYAIKLGDQGYAYVRQRMDNLFRPQVFHLAPPAELWEVILNSTASRNEGINMALGYGKRLYDMALTKVGEAYSSEANMSDVWRVWDFAMSLFLEYEEGDEGEVSKLISSLHPAREQRRDIIDVLAIQRDVALAYELMTALYMEFSGEFPYMFPARIHRHFKQQIESGATPPKTTRKPLLVKPEPIPQEKPKRGRKKRKAEVVEPEINNATEEPPTPDAEFILPEFDEAPEEASERLERYMAMAESHLIVPIERQNPFQLKFPLLVSNSDWRIHPDLLSQLQSNELTGPELVADAVETMKGGIYDYRMPWRTLDLAIGALQLMLNPSQLVSAQHEVVRAEMNKLIVWMDRQSGPQVVSSRWNYDNVEANMRGIAEFDRTYRILAASGVLHILATYAPYAFCIIVYFWQRTINAMFVNLQSDLLDGPRYLSYFDYEDIYGQGMDRDFPAEIQAEFGDIGLEILMKCKPYFDKKLYASILKERDANYELLKTLLNTTPMESWNVIEKVFHHIGMAIPFD